VPSLCRRLGRVNASCRVVDASLQNGAGDAARTAGLRYISDVTPGITRRRIGSGFAYFRPGGRRVRSRQIVTRINALAIPPAYTHVWICPDAQGHIQATGRDARGRKQYRYHSRWRAERDATKYDRMLAFGTALPQIRRRVAADLALPGIPRDRVLATVVRLLETTLIRVGNGEYVRANHSYGLTTLRSRHVDVKGTEIRFEFRGKSGVTHRVTVSEPRLARIVRRCLHIPGQDLFQYLDDEGKPRSIRSTDVNAYLQSVSGADFTAKDYRTWAGSVLAMSELLHLPCGSAREARKNVVTTMKTIAARMGNTPVICRKCYVHPSLLDAYVNGGLKPGPDRRRYGLNRDEATLLSFLHGLRRRTRQRSYSPGRFRGRTTTASALQAAA
jgi:DNA topoisomerase I